MFSAIAALHSLFGRRRPHGSSISSDSSISVSWANSFGKLYCQRALWKLPVLEEISETQEKLTGSVELSKHTRRDTKPTGKFSLSGSIVLQCFKGKIRDLTTSMEKIENEAQLTSIQLKTRPRLNLTIHVTLGDFWGVRIQFILFGTLALYLVHIMESIMKSIHMGK